ncbi:MAG: hypothetical protein GPJ51_09715 [Candidatus Heimdallarchaeota archaeon]|nr:hypothetical protein [Candidatus Heimdallarchaeota archaeon]
MCQIKLRFVILFLVFSGIFPHVFSLQPENYVERRTFSKPITIDSPLYTNPINITSDDDFISYGFSGNGSEESPYVVESFDIETTSEFGINIQETSKHFIVQNGYVAANISGIRIRDTAPNTSVVRNCFSFSYEVDYFSYGIEIRNSDYCKILNNTCSQNDYGIYVFSSEFTLIEGNNCSYNFWSGIRLSYCNFAQIIDNNLTNNLDEGLRLYFIDKSNIEGNYFRNNTFGIRAYHMDLCNVTFNLMFENQRNGVYLDRSDYNLIHHNKFISNNLEGKSQAYDSSSRNENQWYDEAAKEGNYWNDFKTNGFSYKYEIEGSDVIDKYPLDENLEPIEKIYSNLILGIVLLIYLVTLSTWTMYGMRREHIEMRIQRYKNRKKTRKSEPIDRDYDKLVDEEYEKTKKKMLLRGR